MKGKPTFSAWFERLQGLDRRVLLLATGGLAVVIVALVLVFGGESALEKGRRRADDVTERLRPLETDATLPAIQALVDDATQNLAEARKQLDADEPDRAEALLDATETAIRRAQIERLLMQADIVRWAGAVGRAADGEREATQQTKNARAALADGRFDDARAAAQAALEAWIQLLPEPQKSRSEKDSTPFVDRVQRIADARAPLQAARTNVTAARRGMEKELRVDVAPDRLAVLHRDLPRALVREAALGQLEADVFEDPRWAGAPLRARVLDRWNPSAAWGARARALERRWAMDTRERIESAIEPKPTASGPMALLDASNFADGAPEASALHDVVPKMLRKALSESEVELRLGTRGTFAVSVRDEAGYYPIAAGLAERLHAQGEPARYRLRQVLHGRARLEPPATWDEIDVVLAADGETFRLQPVGPDRKASGERVFSSLGVVMAVSAGALQDALRALEDAPASLRSSAAAAGTRALAAHTALAETEDPFALPDLQIAWLRAVLDAREQAWGAAAWDRRLFHENSVTKLRSVWLRDATQLLVQNRLDDAASALLRLQNEADRLQGAQRRLLDVVRFGTEREGWEAEAGPLAGSYQLEKLRTLDALKPSALVREALKRASVRLRLVADGTYVWWMTLEGTRVLCEGGCWRPAPDRSATLAAYVRGKDVLARSAPWPGAPLRVDPETRTFWFVPVDGQANPWAAQVEAELTRQPLSGGKIVIESPEPGYRTRETKVVVQGRVESAIDGGILRVNDRVVALQGDRFETTVELEDGEKRAIEVTYSGGGAFGTEKAYVHVGIDTKPPIIEVFAMSGLLFDEHNDAWCTNKTKLELRGRALDQAVERVDVFIGGDRRAPNPTDVAGGLEFKSRIRGLEKLATKPLLIEVRAVDDVGNEAKPVTRRLLYHPTRYDQLRFAMAMRDSDYYLADRIEKTLRTRHGAGVKRELRAKLAAWRKKPVIRMKGLSYIAPKNDDGMPFPMVLHMKERPLRFLLYLSAMRPTDQLSINGKTYKLSEAQRAGREPAPVDDSFFKSKNTEWGMGLEQGYISIYVEDTLRKPSEERFSTGFMVMSVPTAYFAMMAKSMSEGNRIQTGDVVLPSIEQLTAGEAWSRAREAMGEDD